MEFICLFFPAVISLIFLDRYKKINLRESIYFYVGFNLSINFTILLIAKIIFKLEGYLFNIIFSIKYLFLSCVLAIIYAFLYTYIKKNLNVIMAFFSNSGKKVVVNSKKFLDDIKCFLGSVCKRLGKIFKACWGLLVSDLKKIWKFIVKYKSIVSRIIIFILLLALMFLFDFPLRVITYKLNSFFPVMSLCPIIFDIAYTIIVYSLVIILKKKISIIFLILSYIFNLLFFVTNYMMISIKEEAFSFYDLNNASEGFEYLNFVIKEISFNFIMIIVCSIVLLLLIIILIRQLNHLKLKINIIIFVVSIVIFIGLHFAALATIEDYDNDSWDRVLFPKYYYTNYINPKRSISVAGLYEYTFRDAYLKVKSGQDKKGSVEEIESIMNNSNKKYEKNKYSDIFKGKNLIMIMLESVDHIMFNEENMPTLTYIYNNGLTFSKRYNQTVGAGATIATELTSLTGLYYTDSYYNINNNNYLESIPNIFGNNGYQTNSIHENRGIYYNRVALHKQIGFENSYFVLDHKPDFKRYHDELLVEDEDIYNQIINKGDKENFMSFIVTISTHGPYSKNYACSADATAMASEKGCANYLAKRTDLFLELLLKKLKEDNLLDDTVIVLYADHYAYSYNYTDEDKKLYEKVDDNLSIQNLPLMIYSNGIKGKIFNNIIVDDIDIVPTIFNLFGIKYDPKYYVGTDAFSKDHENVAIFTDNSWYDGNIYSLNKDVDKNSEYYKETTKFVTNTLDLNTMIISNDYYGKDN